MSVLLSVVHGVYSCITSARQNHIPIITAAHDLWSPRQQARFPTVTIAEAHWWQDVELPAAFPWQPALCSLRIDDMFIIRVCKSRHNQHSSPSALTQQMFLAFSFPTDCEKPLRCYVIHLLQRFNKRRMDSTRCDRTCH